MRASRLRLLGLPLATLLIAACSGTSPSPTPEPSPPADAHFRLRVTFVQALPPSATFNVLPLIVITLDGRVLTGGAVAAIFPGPLVLPILERQLSANGWARVVAAARAAGLLGGVRDFTGGVLAPGSQVTRLEIVADGRVYDLSGDAGRVIQCITTPCNPEPGTPEAFASFIAGLGNIESLVGAANLGPEHIHVPVDYGVIVAGPPDDQGLAQPPVGWPLDGGFAAFGKALADGSGGRCGTITGADVDLVRNAFNAATQITKWRDPVDGLFHGLVVKPILPGDDDPCEGLV